METLTIKEELHKLIDSGDESFIRFFYAMAIEYKKTTRKTMLPYTKEQFVKDIKEAEKEIEEGNFQTIDEFEKEAEQWK